MASDGFDERSLEFYILDKGLEARNVQAVPAARNDWGAVG